jgi:hypothetical protein
MCGLSCWQKDTCDFSRSTEDIFKWATLFAHNDFYHLKPSKTRTLQPRTSSVEGQSSVWRYVSSKLSSICTIHTRMCTLLALHVFRLLVLLRCTLWSRVPCVLNLLQKIGLRLIVRSAQWSAKYGSISILGAQHTGYLSALGTQCHSTRQQEAFQLLDFINDVTKWTGVFITSQ